jgi:RimJ/RimL family protein N-acetyltransferase
MDAPIITTKRLRLRGWQDADLEPFAVLNADTQVMEFFVRTLERNQSDAFAQWAHTKLIERGFGLWAVEAPGITPFLGYVGLAEPAFQAEFTPCVEIGWRLAREHWGKGYATEAAIAVIDYAFEDLALSDILSFTAQGNLRSRRVMERLGMRHHPSEDFDHPSIPTGHPLRRHVLYRLTNTDWRSTRVFLNS